MIINNIGIIIWDMKCNPIYVQSSRVGCHFHFHFHSIRDSNFIVVDVVKFSPRLKKSLTSRWTWFWFSFFFFWFFWSLVQFSLTKWHLGVLYYHVSICFRLFLLLLWPTNTKHMTKDLSIFFLHLLPFGGS